MQIQGNIIKIGETKTFGSNGFRKREFVIETNDTYKQTILIETIQDKCDLLNNFEVGQNVDVSININGRTWTNPQGETKYFNSIQGWRIVKAEQSQAQAKPQAEEEEQILPF